MLWLDGRPKASVMTTWEWDSTVDDISAELSARYNSDLPCSPATGSNFHIKLQWNILRSLIWALYHLSILWAFFFKSFYQSTINLLRTWIQCKWYFLCYGLEFMSVFVTSFVVWVSKLLFYHFILKVLSMSCLNQHFLSWFIYPSCDCLPRPDWMNLTCVLSTSGIWLLLCCQFTQCSPPSLVYCLLFSCVFFMCCVCSVWTSLNWTWSVSGACIWAPSPPPGVWLA